MRREWAYNMQQQIDLVMELQQLRVEVPPLIVVHMHRERMFAFEYALVEIRIANNRMMHRRTHESLLRICIQFA